MQETLIIPTSWSLQEFQDDSRTWDIKKEKGGEGAKEQLKKKMLYAVCACAAEL